MNKEELKEDLTILLKKYYQLVKDGELTLARSSILTEADRVAKKLNYQQLKYPRLNKSGRIPKVAKCTT